MRCDSILKIACRFLRPRRYNGAAMISQDLLDILACPVCKKVLAMKDNGEGLKCAECRRVYPIQDGIPIMLIDAATIDAA
jgi:uncharacterized protein YbaR (Trm112 family)